MTVIINDGQSIKMTGKSGREYTGRICTKESESSFTGGAIVCLTNSHFVDHQWQHAVNSIHKTEDVETAMAAFKERGDISHLIIIPQPSFLTPGPDVVDDLIRRYIHR